MTRESGLFYDLKRQNILKIGDYVKICENEKKKKAYEYQKNAGLEVKPKKEKKKYSLRAWNKLTPAERWELMTLNEVAVENLKYHIPTYGKSEAMARWGKLPEDYGKREKKNG